MPDPSTAERLQARYGTGPRARWPWVVLAVPVAVLLVLAGYLGWQLSSPAVTSDLLAFDIVSAQRVDVTFEVRAPAGRTTYCVLRAQDIQHQDVGYATVLVGSGDGRTAGTYPLATRARAVVGEVLGCALDAPPIRVSPPQFPPGTTNPSQQPSLAPSASAG